MLKQKAGGALKCLGLAIFTLLIIFPSVTSAQSASLIQQLQSPFYDPNSADSACPTNSFSACCESDSGTVLTGNSNGQKVFNYFVGKGFSNESAAAVTGNLQVESAGFTVIDGWGGGGGNYYGLAQWSRDNRYVNLIKFAGSTESAAQLSYQLDFIWYELHNGYQSTLQELQGNDSLQNKAIFWGRNYEVAVNPDGSLQAQYQRVADAVIWNNQASGTPTPAGSTDASTTDGGCSISGVTANADGYSNPFHGSDGLVQSRIDEGVDYASTKPVPIYAIGNGIVTIATSNSSFYTTTNGYADWITYQLTDGPAAGKYVYVAEACPPLVNTGDHVTSDTHLCDVQPDSIETGWALNATSQAAAAINVYTEGYETAYGVNFNQLLVKLGAPSGHLDSTSDPSGAVLGTLPGGWPAW